ncbi:hypothetical protein [Pseudomonas sp.]|uniref:hypothetical protein n=1 Tax=Pseudomonas sp. TaxID=306 RepID=UPI00289E95F6|nr:hypothetical protein [Pseudomonas sp.]
MNASMQMPARAPKESLPFLAALLDKMGDNMNEETETFIGWIDQQISLAQSESLEEALRYDQEPRANNFVYLESWRPCKRSFRSGRKSFSEWINEGAFSNPQWTWRALKGLHFSQVKLRVRLPSSASLH